MSMVVDDPDRPVTTLRYFLLSFLTLLSFLRSDFLFFLLRCHFDAFFSRFL